MKKVMSWSQTNRAVLALTPDAVFTALSTVELWPQWCPGVAAASFDGALRVGQSGSMELSLPVVGPIHRATAPPVGGPRVRARIQDRAGAGPARRSPDDRVDGDARPAISRD